MTNETADTSAETNETPTVGAAAEDLGRALGDLFGVGRLWAVHGLTVGRSTLDASASTLRITADLLGDLAERFVPEDQTATVD